MYRIIDAANCGNVLSLDEIETLEDARQVADDIEQHESMPDVAIQRLVGDEWVAVPG